MYFLSPKKHVILDSIYCVRRNAILDLCIHAKGSWHRCLKGDLSFGGRAGWVAGDAWEHTWWVYAVVYAARARQPCSKPAFFVVQTGDQSARARPTRWSRPCLGHTLDTWASTTQWSTLCLGCTPGTWASMARWSRSCLGHTVDTWASTALPAN